MVSQFMVRMVMQILMEQAELLELNQDINLEILQTELFGLMELMLQMDRL